MSHLAITMCGGVKQRTRLSIPGLERSYRSDLMLPSLTSSVYENVLQCNERMFI